MQTFSITEARARFADLVRSTKRGVVRITDRNRPAAAVLDWEEYESMMETLEILSDPGFMEQLRAGEKDLEEGRLVDWSEVKPILES